VSTNNGHDETAAPAIMVRIACGCGPSRQMEMTFGVPLDMTPHELNQYVDKVMMVADRQTMKGALDAEEIILEGARKQLHTAIEQKGNYIGGQELQWIASGRKGPFKMNPSQEAQVTNWDKNISELKERRIPEAERKIAELRAAIEAGVQEPHTGH